MKNNEGMKKILFILLLVPTVSYSLCLGIFKDKDECEAMQAFKKDEKVCSQFSLSKCENLRKTRSKSLAYCNCLDLHRGNCMASLGWDRSIGFSACHNDD